MNVFELRSEFGTFLYRTPLQNLFLKKCLEILDNNEKRNKNLKYQIIKNNEFMGFIDNDFYFILFTIFDKKGIKKYD